MRLTPTSFERWPSVDLTSNRGSRAVDGLRSCSAALNYYQQLYRFAPQYHRPSHATRSPTTAEPSPTE